jgi:hypothetical protein
MQYQKEKIIKFSLNLLLFDSMLNKLGWQGKGESDFSAFLLTSFLALTYFSRFLLPQVIIFAFTDIYLYYGVLPDTPIILPLILLLKMDIGSPHSAVASFYPCFSVKD